VTHYDVRPADRLSDCCASTSFRASGARHDESGTGKWRKDRGRRQGAALQAKNSEATTIALALAGADLTNAIKQANEFRVADGGQNLAAMLEAAANPFRLRQISACELAHDLSPAFLLVGPH
jgi:hypothetical protein